MESKTRLNWIDMAKGYGMLLVIFGHLGVNILGTWIYSFHMPLFFFLSGCVFSNKRKPVDFIKHKCKTMVVPYFCLGIPILFIDNGTFTINGVLQRALHFIIQRRLYTIWFLACLFFLEIFFYFITKYIKSNKILLLLSLIFPVLGFLNYKYLNIILPWNMDICLMAFPFFFTGYYFKNNIHIFNKIYTNKIYPVILFFVLGLINIATVIINLKFTGNTLEMFSCIYGILPITYVSAFAGIFCVIIIAKWFSFAPISYIGKNTLVYFVWHNELMMPISAFILSLFNLTISDSSSGMDKAIFRIIQFVIILAVLTLCNFIITNTKFRIILGKNINS